MDDVHVGVVALSEISIVHHASVVGGAPQPRADVFCLTSLYEAEGFAAGSGCGQGSAAPATSSRKSSRPTNYRIYSAALNTGMHSTAGTM